MFNNMKHTSIHNGLNHIFMFNHKPFNFVWGFHYYIKKTDKNIILFRVSIMHKSFIAKYAKGFEYSIIYPQVVKNSTTNKPKGISKGEFEGIGISNKKGRI